MPSSDAPPAARDGWTVVVPVKSPGRGKSRIAVDPAQRPAIAAALATDTVTAVASARSVARVVVVTDGGDRPGWLAELPTTGAEVVVLASAADSLNAAIAEGVAVAPGPVAVVPGDLPQLTGPLLDEVLGALTAPLSVVPDAEGVGTTLLAARELALLQPRYGVGSFRRHRELGAVEVALPVDHPLRRDVDTVADLAAVPGGRTATAARAAGVVAAVVSPLGTAGVCAGR